MFYCSIFVITSPSWRCFLQSPLLLWRHTFGQLTKKACLHNSWLNNIILPQGIFLARLWETRSTSAVLVFVVLFYPCYAKQNYTEVSESQCVCVYRQLADRENTFLTSIKICLDLSVFLTLFNSLNILQLSRKKSWAGLTGDSSDSRWIKMQH